MEDVTRVNRQHRRGAAEQHREQIEADRAEHDLVVADVSEPLDDRAQRVRIAGIAARDRPDQQHAGERDGVEDGRGFVGQARSTAHKPRRRASGPATAPACQAIEFSAIALGSRAGGTRFGAIDAERGPGEGAADAEQHRDREQGRQRHRVEPDQKGERGGAQHLHRDADPARSSAGRPGRRHSRRPGSAGTRAGIGRARSCRARSSPARCSCRRRGRCRRRGCRSPRPASYCRSCSPAAPPRRRDSRETGRARLRTCEAQLSRSGGGFNHGHGERGDAAPARAAAQHFSKWSAFSAKVLR